MSEQRFQSFGEFYPYYLDEHRNQTCRRLHVIGSLLVLVIVATSIISANPWWLLLVPLAGYGFAWAGHFFFEHNRPATFKYPLYSLLADWVMLADTLRGKLRF